MERLGFGLGEYRYFARPLPAVVRELRTALYRRLAPVANAWARKLRAPERFPLTHGGFLRTCAARKQTKPTPLLLHYGPGGYNCLHQDLYGDVAFPLQATVFLSAPGRDFGGGEFLLVENRPRAQARGMALSPNEGEMIVFATRERPVEGRRGVYRARMRHGVSPLAWGERYALGIIFHDAR